MGDVADDTVSGNGTDEWCEFSELLKATCSHCKDAERKKARPPSQKLSPEQREAIRPSFRRPSFRGLSGIEAQFEGHCTECGFDIEVGEIIIKDADGDWIHKECP